MDRSGFARNPYQDRHTYASALLTSSQNPRYAVDHPGHEDVTMVFRTFGSSSLKATDPAGGEASAKGGFRWPRPLLVVLEGPALIVVSSPQHRVPMSVKYFCTWFLTLVRYFHPPPRRGLQLSTSL